jgi:hydroxyacylglutathione hydrolase
MYLRQFFIEGLGHGSYLVGDDDSGEGAVVDPRRDVDVYVEAALEAGLTIRHVVETHTHNDYVSGARELATLAGAEYWASGANGGAGLRFAHRSLTEGDAVPVGSVTLRAWETPGHTPEHLALLAFEGSASTPTAVFSGGSLMVGSAGRSDLSGAERTQELARAQGASVRRLMTLPAHVQVYPTHGGGSFCGAGGGSRWSTIGQEAQTNELAGLAARNDADAFAGRLLGDLPVVPAYWARMRPLNGRGPRSLAALGAVPGDAGLLPARRLSAAAVRDLVEREQVYVVDARDPLGFGGGHIPGSFGVGLGQTFGIWVGSVVPDDRPLVLVLPGMEEGLPAVAPAVWEAAVRQLLRVGYERIAGVLEGGLRGWTTAGFPIQALPPLTVHDTWARLQRGEHRLLDVRQPKEWAAGHAPGATFIPGARFPDRLNELDRNAPWAVACSTGYRSTVVASVLQRAGITEVANVLGGMTAWNAAELPIGPVAQR